MQISNVHALCNACVCLVSAHMNNRSVKSHLAVVVCSGSVVRDSRTFVGRGIDGRAPVFRDAFCYGTIRAADVEFAAEVTVKAVNTKPSVAPDTTHGTISVLTLWLMRWLVEQREKRAARCFYDANPQT